MKKVLALFLASFLTFNLFAQTATLATNTVTKPGNISTSSVQPNSAVNEVLVLKEAEYDFGKIPQGKPVTHVFEFKNIGSSPFSLENVQASCGCTTPEWNKDIIAPGATAKITIGYNAQNEGTFTKPVTITYNGNQTKQIIIKGDVWKTPVSSAPENTKINSLKNEQ